MSHKKHFKKNFISANDRSDFYALWKDNRLIGVYVIEDKYIDYLAIHPKYQSLGYGSLLLHHCINTLKSRNQVQRIFTTVQKTNEGALIFYKKNGFVEYSQFIEYNY
jgi:ribosomal protein S18 acetylase RimI-like enzyme